MSHQGDFVRDRGQIKWTAMMLPEHRKELKDLWDAQDDVDKPMYDDDKLAELSQEISLCIHENKLVSIKYYNSKRYRILSGIITKYDPELSLIMVETKERQGKISVSDIVEIVQDE
jgi:hypothetical protein